MGKEVNQDGSGIVTVMNPAPQEREAATMRGAVRKRLILPGWVQAQMCRGIQMTFVVTQGMLMGFEVSRRIQGQNVMCMIKLMRKRLPH